MKYLAIILMTMFASCLSDTKDRALSYQDTISVLSIAFKGKYVKEILLEQGMSKDSIIYIVTDSLTRKEYWPETINEFKVKLTDSFNINRNFIEQAHDRRFTISRPEIKLIGDTLNLNFHAFSFYMRHQFKFIKRQDKWVKIYENAYQQ